ncbi:MULTISPECIES: ribosomal protein S18-alanine N-acetyltransferase [Pyrobaculum]|uniref:Ribosomal protein S18-alanine N-acetyltransferase n=2 Tax=Pyrobaculum arsenaticum TaxID=121277 RepID=A0A7L4PGW1_9CREN|nr:ribosomal protein S18-alanine N-acetyltransferase [Pyrobaculum arsenaticum]NYR16576.1 ribosomal protein S18-alanine N-acetyltransferase [Pyrobaculum arsenaticum]
MLRRCQAADIPHILEVEKKSFKPEDIYSEELLRFLCAYCGEHSFVYINDNVLAGYIITCIEGGVAHVITIAVDPEYRRRGIGKALLCTAMQLLADGKVSEVFLEVRASNTVAQALYKSAGFEQVEVLRSYYSDGEDGYRLSLRDKKKAREFCLYVEKPLDNAR